MIKAITKVMGVIFMSYLFGSCKKLDVAAPSFKVSLASTSYNVGDTIKFNFEGYADYITYYSGEQSNNYPNLLGNRYEFSNRSLAKGKAVLSFQTLQQNNAQANSLSVLISKNFNGIYDSANVSTANWTDITNRFTLSDGQATSFVNTGNIDISDFNDSTLFIAFKYKSSTGNVQPRWTINNLALTFYAQGSDSTNLITNDTLSILSLNPAWRAVNVLNNAQRWSVTTSQLFFPGATATATDNEDWVISRDLCINHVPTDKPTSIVKTYTDAMMTSYAAPVFKKAGKYKVVFVAKNANIHHQKSTNYEFLIEVK